MTVIVPAVRLTGRHTACLKKKLFIYLPLTGRTSFGHWGQGEFEAQTLTTPLDMTAMFTW